MIHGVGGLSNFKYFRKLIHRSGRKGLVGAKTNGRHASAGKGHAIRLASFIFNRNSLKKCKQETNTSDVHLSKISVKTPDEGITKQNLVLNHLRFIDDLQI